MFNTLKLPIETIQEIIRIFNNNSFKEILKISKKIHEKAKNTPWNCHFQIDYYILNHYKIIFQLFSYWKISLQLIDNLVFEEKVTKSNNLNYFENKQEFKKQDFHIRWILRLILFSSIQNFFEKAFPTNSIENRAYEFKNITNHHRSKDFYEQRIFELWFDEFFNKRNLSEENSQIVKSLYNADLSINSSLITFIEINSKEFFYQKSIKQFLIHKNFFNIALYALSGKKIRKEILERFRKVIKRRKYLNHITDAFVRKDCFCKFKEDSFSSFIKLVYLLKLDLSLTEEFKKVEDWIIEKNSKLISSSEIDLEYFNKLKKHEEYFLSITLKERN